MLLDSAGTRGSGLRGWKEGTEFDRKTRISVYLQINSTNNGIADDDGTGM